MKTEFRFDVHGIPGERFSLGRARRPRLGRAGEAFATALATVMGFVLVVLWQAWTRT